MVRPAGQVGALGEVGTRIAGFAGSYREVLSTVAVADKTDLERMLNNRVSQYEETRTGKR